MAGMKERGIDAPTRERIFEQLKGFADFGFPESHSFSFAHIVYASSWLKVHAPEHFYAAILASQPMGFYSPATLVQDARRHGVRVVGPSVNDSLVDASVQRVSEDESGESYSPGCPESLPSRGTVPLDVDADLAVRIGLNQVRGLGAASERIVEARCQGAFASQADLARRAHGERGRGLREHSRSHRLGAVNGSRFFQARRWARACPTCPHYRRRNACNRMSPRRG